MTNRVPFKHKQGHPGRASGKKTSGVPNSSTLLQGTKMNDFGPPVCDLLDTPLLICHFLGTRGLLFSTLYQNWSYLLCGVLQDYTVGDFPHLCEVLLCMSCTRNMTKNVPQDQKVVSAK